MAEIFLSEAGAAIGQRVLPGSVNLLGRQIGGAQIGRTLGALAGGAIDDALFGQDIDGPRLKALHIMESRDGAGMANVYGRMRVGGQLIWAGGFRETRTQTGGKGGPTINQYSYTVSFAVALCEGPGVRLHRAWANGEALSLGGLVHRVYDGGETQMPDPVIEAEEGAGKAPAYRGTAYIVFEDFPLADWGNRIPQLSFEVSRAPAAAGRVRLSDMVRDVNIIPASGEFVYATEIVRERTFPGRERALNAHAEGWQADFLVSLEQLRSELPNVSAVSLTLGWFGDDLRAGACRIRPGVETRDRVSVPWSWTAGGVSREDAYLISKTDDGAANYGGTPDDRSVLQAIAALKGEGLAVTLTPFLLMDVPPGNTLPDAHGAPGQPAFPWRGRIFGNDGTQAARSEVEAFAGRVGAQDFRIESGRVIYTGPSGDWGYRRFILHCAYLAKAAGGVEGFLIGSEMRTLTRLRDDGGHFPFVEVLIELADDVKALLGPGCKVSYAADWSEYGAYVPGDGSGDVLFPLDPLWARASVDYVGIDWYPPAGDWRDGGAHVDALAGYGAPDEAAYLRHNQMGGEGFDWYYTSTEDRLAQNRTPIIDTGHGEHWVFRPKDVLGWWGAAHHERPGGVRSNAPTGWVAGSKPLKFCEIGFPAVDKGTNSPNLFFDPKSSESAVPPFSDGQRDDVLQQRALIEVLDLWQDETALAGASVWAWDARPYPAFPSRSDVWSDGENWLYGHWLNGRTGLATLSAVVADLCERAGVEVAADVDGLVEGYVLDGPMSVETALAPLVAAFDLSLIETRDGLRVVQPATLPVIHLETAELVEGGEVRIRETGAGEVSRLVLTYADPASAWQPATSDLRTGASGGETRQFALPLALSGPVADAVGAHLFARLSSRDAMEVSVPSGMVDVSAGKRVRIGPFEAVWVVDGVEQGDAIHLDLSPALEQLVTRSGGSVRASVPAQPAADPDLIVLDVPRLSPGDTPERRVLLASYADPWPGRILIDRGRTPADLDRVAELDRPAMTGRLIGALAAGPLYRWDRASQLLVEMAESALGSREEDAVLASANRILVETAAGWELLAFTHAELIGAARYRLTGLLRGLLGTEAACLAGAAAGARCVLVDPALVPVAMAASDLGATYLWRAGGGEAQEQRYEHVAGKPWSIAIPRWDTASGLLSWSERGPDIPDEWDAPDPETGLRFEVEWQDAGGGLWSETVVAQTSVASPPEAVLARIRAISSTGQTGEWVSITRGAP